ncbi:MAG TPA: 16S rRNA (cytidine(1402)-2'-O)-methyltransferase [Thermoanaerobaculia bacterium]|nr:16S rRNA (cytidine(1402)-2'-O)-methyltransferase [Thermoanaerobaculia bacterium]
MRMKSAVGAIENTMPGKLLLIGTPIGNLDDLSPRAIEALNRADLILCEDTRHTRKLLTHFGISRPAESFHEHNEDAKAARMLDRIEAGETIALVSDAGMPVVSDPGFKLVRLARERGVDVEPIPGPFAGVLALAASGIPPAPFTFFGFAPHRHGDRADFYRHIAETGHTAIVYESPERVLDSLRDALAILGDVEASVAREMTKLHEEHIRGRISEVLAVLADRDSIRGEITLVFAAAAKKTQEVSAEEIRAELDRLRASGLRRNDVVKAIAEKFGMRKNDVYRALLGIEN